jgi:hypothetical protein
VLLRAPVLWGVVFGGIQAASPLGFWWLDPATVYALSLTLIAAVYIGFAVADGRPSVLAVESGVAGVFVVLAAMGHRTGVAAGVRLHRPWTQGPLAGAPPLCGQYSMVAAVLPGRRLGRGGAPRGADRRQRRLPPLELKTTDEP